MRAVGFREDVDSGLTCRWRHRDDADLILDAMPTKQRLHRRQVAIVAGTLDQLDGVQNAGRRCGRSA
jgi:hypothetical protein